MPLPNFGGERSSTNRFALRPAFLEPGSGGRPWFATCKAAPSDPRMKRPPAYFYDLDERPPWHWLVLYALQWAVILFPALIIAARLCAQALNLTAAEEVRFVQLTLLVSGLFTVFQTLYGHRYPVLEGPSTAVLLTYALLARNGLGVIQGGAIIAVMDIVEVITWEEALARYPDQDQYISGPLCWVIGSVRQLPEPIPCPGRLSLWECPDL